jgi:tryptophan-rich sensory protein
MRGRGETIAPILVAAAAAVVVAGLGAAMTDLTPWYRSLVKPTWQPPDWLFGPVWTVVFATTALSGYFAWRSAPDRATRMWIVGLFALNGFFNVLWSALFFRLQRPDWALLEVVILWASILVLLLSLRRVSTRASWLLAPYLAWVSFAAVLNWTVVRLNAPF